jgi:hypothetical protein
MWLGFGLRPIFRIIRVQTIPRKHDENKEFKVHYLVGVCDIALFLYKLRG